MLDPVTTPLLILVLGKIAHDVISEACKDHLKDKLKSFFGWLEKLGQKDKVELAYQDAMEQAYGTCLEMLLVNIKGFGYSNEELKQYKSSLEAFIKDDDVAGELLNAIREPGRNNSPSADVLSRRWNELGNETLPSDSLWPTIVAAFRRQATKRVILSNELRELLNAQNLEKLTELIERQGGVKVEVRRDKYSQRMRTKFAPVDLANLMPSFADDPGRLVIRDVFVPTSVVENPPPVEIPKDLVDDLLKRGLDALPQADGVDKQDLERLHAAYVSQLRQPLLNVIAAPVNRLLVLIGEPGSGKTTLLRYLLTGVIEPPFDNKAGLPLPWTLTFQDAFPLLIELRDFYALRKNGECDSFLEYVAYMGKTDHWSLDDHAANSFLENGTSLVMFDGLDEIFDHADRQRILQEISGFAQRYPKARIIVTSRPVGYKEQTLRDAGFRHFGIQDLGDEQIKSFVQGWFTLTFPQNHEQADQRIKRVTGSIQRSKSIRLLAGNPMLLTIMALLAREEELPRERAKFYEKSVEVLCHHWDVNRNLELPDDRYLNADDKKKLLRRIAMRMQAAKSGLKGNIIHNEDLEHEIQGYLIDENWQPNEAQAKQAARRVIRQLRDRNYILCLRGPHFYGFVHRTFLEYLTAAEFVQRFDKQPQTMSLSELLRLFVLHYKDAEWREVLRLICGQIDIQFVGQILARLTLHLPMHAGTDVNGSQLILALWCLSEVRQPARLENQAVHVFAKVANFLRTSIEFWLSERMVEACEAIPPPCPGQKYVRENALVFSSFDAGGELRWPRVVAAIVGDRDLLLKLTLSRSGPLRAGAYGTLATRWPDDNIRRILEDRAVEDADENVRRVAFEALTQNWPDDNTRRLLEVHAVEDVDKDVRGVAFEALAQNWPNDNTRCVLENRTVKDESKYARLDLVRILAQAWPDDNTRRILEDRAVEDKDEDVRRVALQTLARSWPNDKTRRIFEELALKDEHYDVRRAAFEVLAQICPDDNTRHMLGEYAAKDESRYVRRMAVEALARNWSDDNTRHILEELATKDEDGDVQHIALQALAQNWPDDNTRRILELRATNSALQHIVLQALAQTWPDDNTRRVLERLAIKDGEADTRSIAAELLAQNWPDANTRRILEDRTAKDEFGSVRGVAVEVLARNWSDDNTRRILEDRAVEDEDEDVRRAAFEALARIWPDDSTRRILEELAAKDRSQYTRLTALETLAWNWPDDRARRLLEDRAVKDEIGVIRRVAFQVLAWNWPDDDTRRVLEDRAINDKIEGVRWLAFQALTQIWSDDRTQQLITEASAVDGAAASLRAAAHSRFGEIMFTENCDGRAPYLNPKEPIPSSYSQAAADRSGIDPDQINEVVLSLSEYMGWDITRGSKSAP
jgi:hypothetical protein